jgi:hypothetical protein
MTLYEIVKKLNGPIYPVGESTEDKNRLENIKNLFPLVEQLLMDIKDAADFKNDSRHSMMQIGKRADEFLSSIKETHL